MDYRDLVIEALVSDEQTLIDLLADQTYAAIVWRQVARQFCHELILERARSQAAQRQIATWMGVDVE